MVERFLNGYANAFQRWMPAPLSIAVLLTGLAALLALRDATASDVLGAWTQGMWSPGLIRFGFQAMFMLVLGHVLALAPPVMKALGRGVNWVVKDARWVASKVALLSMGLGWLNWGLGLIGGAILVKGVMDEYRRRGGKSPVHLGVLGAAGYSGMLIWHGGLSGSAPLKVAEKGHLQELIGEASWALDLPDSIGLRETVFSSWSLALTATVALLTVALFAWLGRTVKSNKAVPDAHAVNVVVGQRASILVICGSAGPRPLAVGHHRPCLHRRCCLVGLLRSSCARAQIHYT